MSRTSITKQAKSRKKKATRKGNGKAKAGNGAAKPAAQEAESSASTRWFQMLNSLELRDLYTLADMVSKRIGNREAAGKDLVAKPATRETRMLDIAEALDTLAAQIDVASEAAANVDQEALETTLYELSQAVRAQGDALTELCRAAKAEGEVVS
jgi:hypothetical protein